MNRLLRTILRTRLSEEAREAQLRRILFVETNIMLPVKLVAILWAIYFYGVIRRQLEMTGQSKEVAQAYFTQLNFYAAGNLIFWCLLLAAQLGQMWPRVLRFSAFWLGTLDSLFLSGLIYFTGGLDSALYWLYVGLMIRSAIDFPVFWQQAVLNISTCVFYTVAVELHAETAQMFGEELYWLRLALLVLLGVCCWGVYLLLERERRRHLLSQEFELRAQKTAATGRLAAEIAHQLKNPLGIINNAAFLLQKQLAHDGPGPREAVQVIRDEVTRSDKILTELMNYSRLSEGRIEYLSVNTLLNAALAQVRPSELPSNIKVVEELDPALPPLPGQRTELEECFANLMKNAIDAMPDGGTLKVRSRYAGHGRIEVDIEDTGRGIAATELTKIFDAFYTTKTGGTGLGLAIVKNLVETYGGTIAVDSEVDQGTQFHVVLPVRTSEVK